MSLHRLFENIRERFPIDEENGEVYDTPYAFSKKVEEPDDAAYSEPVDSTERFYKKIEERINEIAYSDFKKDSTKNERQKINNHILEINKKLREVEQMITHAHKLKNESGQDSGVFWKRTQGSFIKIKERLNRLTSKIVEITG